MTEKAAGCRSREGPAICSGIQYAVEIGRRWGPRDTAERSDPVSAA